MSTAFDGFKAEIDLTDLAALSAELERRTLWDVMRSLPPLDNLAPAWTNETFQLLATPDELVAERAIRRILTHTELLAVVCRLDHPFIDLYSLRSARRGDAETDADSNLINGFVELLIKQSRSGVGFSSFQILHDIACNLDLLIKLNFADAYHTSADKLTRYLTAQLNPLSPVSGATGENSTNRSPLARKFRMPGYPRVLISTDVFQEGEDLHTFCDSIQHYGISASPIALEQKVGRVDRIASMAHRRMGSDGEHYGQHFIQVGYPHIRESLEFFQVRQAAANLNAFQRSLHRLGDGGASFQQSIDMREQLASSSTIEPQITEPLESLFKISTEDLIGEDFRSLLQTEQGGVVRRLAHVRSQVEHCLTQLLNDSTTPVRLHETTNGWSWDGNGAVPVAFQVRSARGLAELLISATSRAAIDCPCSESQTSSRVTWLRELQKDPLVRLQWNSFDTTTGVVTLKRNAEVYAGGEEVLISIEVDDIYQRVLGAVPESDTPSEKWDGIRQKIKALCKVNGRVSICEEADCRLQFTFHHEGRKQPVDWCLSGSHVVFSSVVLDKQKTLALTQAGKTIADCPLITHTLRRNLAFDLVDFYIDQHGQLAVRACHPINHLNNEELEFIACSVASEADRLEQILLGLVGSD